MSRNLRRADTRGRMCQAEGKARSSDRTVSGTPVLLKETHEPNADDEWGEEVDESSRRQGRISSRGPIM